MENPNDQTMEVKVNEEFTVSLPHRPSTGYSWKVKEMDENMAQFVSNNYKAPSGGGAGRAVGGTGAQLMTFKATATGQGTISLVNVGPGRQPSADDTVQTVKLTIT